MLQSNAVILFLLLLLNTLRITVHRRDNIMPSVPDVSLVKTCFQPNPKRNLFYKLYPTWN